MVINKDLYIVNEIPFKEPVYGCKPEKGIPDIIAITTTREEAYRIATRYLEYKNFRKQYSIVYLSYYNGMDGEYWGNLYNNYDLNHLVGIMGADVVIDEMFEEDCPLYFNNVVSNSLNVMHSIKDFRTMCNWIKEGIKNYFTKISM